jgi:hypothetical protein
MKLIMIRKLKYILPIAILSIASCKKDLDINTDPNNPVNVSLSTLLPTAQVNLATSLTMETGLSQELSVYMHQLVVRESPDKYGLVPNEIGWGGFYINTLSNIEAIIAKAVPAEDTKYLGIAKILKAYTYSQLVDVWADVPFSESQAYQTGAFYPKFDKGQDIYPKLITLLDDAISDINNTTAKNPDVPGANDVIYKGVMTKWIKAANTIKLKLYLQQRRVKNVSNEINAILALPATQLISSTADDFLVPFGPNGAQDDRNPGFGDYFASQRTNDISPWFYEIMKGYNPDINSGITDPRTPYYWYNQLRATQAGSQLTEYRDGAFVSIYFASVGKDRGANQQNNMTVLGMYPVGGRYDDGLGSVVTSGSGTGAAPYRMITYADRLYMEAELINTGVVVGDARAKLKAAMTESFKQVDYVITTYVKPAQSVPAIYNVATTSPMNTYIDQVLTQYDGFITSKKLQSIMTQKWISTFGSAVDAYTDYRRTGFPVLFNPNAYVAAGTKVQPPINGDPTMPGAQDAIPLSKALNYPLSFYWPKNELDANINAPKQKTDLSTVKPFWLP